MDLVDAGPVPGRPDLGRDLVPLLNEAPRLVVEAHLHPGPLEAHEGEAGLLQGGSLRRPGQDRPIPADDDPGGVVPPQGLQPDRVGGVGREPGVVVVGPDLVAVAARGARVLTRLLWVYTLR